MSVCRLRSDMVRDASRQRTPLQGFETPEQTPEQHQAPLNSLPQATPAATNASMRSTDQYDRGV